MEDLSGVGKALEAIRDITQEMREFLTNLLGPPTEEMGELFHDKVKYLRFKNTVRTLQKAQRFLHDNGIHPKAISLKTLFPILENSSLEDGNSELAEKWVGLLASAATGDSVHPSYPKILAELTPIEARILDAMYNRFTQYRSNEQKAFFTMSEIYSELGLSVEQFEIALVNLARLALYNGPFETGGLDMLMVTSEVIAMPMKLTPLGENFVKVCRGPQLPAVS